MVGPGAVVNEQLTCPVGYKGVVAGWEYEDGLIPLGNDPQPITRVFKIWNPTGDPLDATLHLLCLRLRTGSEPPANRVRQHRVCDLEHSPGTRRGSLGRSHGDGPRIDRSRSPGQPDHR